MKNIMVTLLTLLLLSQNSEAGNLMDHFSRNNSTPCNAATEGTQRYNTTTKVMEFCDGSAWQLVGSTMPAGTVAYFDLAACPSGWTDFAAGLNRSPVGAGGTYALGEQGGAATHTLSVAEMPSHTHSIDPPSTTSTSAGSHTHDVNPASVTTSTDGAHTHSVDPASTSTSTTGAHTHDISDNYVGSTPTGGGGASPSAANASAPETTTSAGNHSHTVDIPATTSTSSGSHSHTVDVGNTTSTSAGSHTHNTDISSFTSGSQGSGTAFNNMHPYIGLTACKKN